MVDSRAHKLRSTVTHFLIAGTSPFLKASRTRPDHTLVYRTAPVERLLGRVITGCAFAVVQRENIGSKGPPPNIICNKRRWDDGWAEVHRLDGCGMGTQGLF